MAAAADTLQRDLRVQPRQVAPGLTARTGVSLFSWGENILVSVAGSTPQGTSVTVRSSSLVPIQIIDFGKNRRNVQKLTAGINGRLTAGPAGAPAGQPPAGPPPAR